MIRVRCYSCEKSLAVKDELAGKTIACPGCKARITVPTASSTGSTAFTKEKAAAPLPPPMPPPMPRSLDLDDEEEEQPRRRRQQDEDEDEDEDEDSRPRRREPRSPIVRRKRTSDVSFGMFAVFLGLVIVVNLMMLAFHTAAPVLRKVVYYNCLVFGIAGWLWLANLGFREGMPYGIICTIFPLSALVVLPRERYSVLQPLFMHAICISLAIFAVVMESPPEGPPGPTLVTPTGPAWAKKEDPPEVKKEPTLEPKKEPTPEPKKVPTPEAKKEPTPEVKKGKETVDSLPDERVPPDPPSGAFTLLAHWTFDEGAGAKARDSGPSGLEAVLTGCSWAPGVKGKAVQLNGTSDFLRLSPSPTLNFAPKAPFTIAGWVKTTKPRGVILSLRPESDLPYDMLNLSLVEGKLFLQFRNQGNASKPPEARSGWKVNDDHWHHFAVTRQSDGNMNLFVDGRRHDILKGATFLQWGKFITTNRVIGAEALVLAGHKHSFFDQSRFDGCLDELQFYAGALGNETVRKLAKAE